MREAYIDACNAGGGVAGISVTGSGHVFNTTVMRSVCHAAFSTAHSSFVDSDDGVLWGLAS
jgi:hypothetical protein